MSEKILSKLVVGDKVGRLTILEIIPEKRENNKKIKRKVRCICDCGNETIAQHTNVHYGNTKSCGCHGRTVAITHGQYLTKEYNIWCAMKSRCNYKSHRAYQHYGARGIRVCERWEHNYDNFIADMGKRPSDKHSIERIDNDGDYEPSNCKWATKIEQAANQRPKKRKGVLRKCIKCNKDFYLTQSMAKRPNREHCSRECRYPIYVLNCLVCQTEFKVIHSRYGKKKYCSNTCKGLGYSMGLH